MGQMVYIKLKKDVNPEPINKFLEKHKLNQFTVEEDNIWWLNDINNNPKSEQSHLKPADRDLTMDELKAWFSAWTEVNLMGFDVGYSRTSQKQIDLYCQMILANLTEIEYIKGAKDVIERYDVSDEMKALLTKLNKPEKKPELLPESEQHRPDLEGGLFLCKSFSIKPFWVIFGRVDTPKFLKVKLYKDDDYNTIYHDKQGYGYLMLPLLKLNGKELDSLADMYQYAYGMGLREDFTLLIPLIYHLAVADFDNVADNYIDTYTNPNELAEKFEQVFKYITAMHPFSDTAHTGFHYSPFKKQFRVNISNNTLEAQIGVLTCLLRAMIKKYNLETATNIMNKVTGRTYLPIELK
jgi:hypothetical protein